MLADCATEIYAASEEPIPGITYEFGLVTNTVNSSSDNPGDVNASIPYGTTQ